MGGRRVTVEVKQVNIAGSQASHFLLRGVPARTVIVPSPVPMKGVGEVSLGKGQKEVMGRWVLQLLRHVVIPAEQLCRNSFRRSSRPFLWAEFLSVGSFVGRIIRRSSSSVQHCAHPG